MEQETRWSDSLRQSGNKSSSQLHDAANNNEEQCDRNLLLQQDVQAAVSESGRQKIEALLEQICGLLPIEQLLLYLKLPTEQTPAVDPLRKSTNPLGSRSEITQTIIWIQTHLEEDSELSLQKKGVYEHYVAYCEPNGIKPLSTADFGKVMKQVYPSVRPRRLGTRGQSKYCYSGLRSRMKLDVPALPDLSESSCGHADCMAAVWLVIKEWAEVKLSMPFKSAVSLAYYLVKELSIAMGSEAAQLVQTLACSSALTESLYGYANRHKETGLHLQRKLQQIKDTHKRKGIDKSEPKFRCKKLKKSPPSTSCSTSPIGDPQVEYAANCDMGIPLLPDFQAIPRSASGGDPAQRNKGKGYVPRASKPSPGKRRNKCKPKQECDQEANAKTLRQRVKKEELAFLPNELSDPYFSRERLESVSQVSKDALDEYLGGASNGQEPEEEIIKYLGNEEEESSKLTQLRELLVQNCPGSASTAAAAKASRRSRPNLGTPGAKRRVSFERSVNFKPIASPTGKLSMCSSTNASPFVSPRSTPVMRSRSNVHAHAPPPLPPQQPAVFRSQVAGMPMSAPPSPKTYGYGGGSRLYMHMQTYHQPMDAFRSQSVPVAENEMFNSNAFNFPPSECALPPNEMLSEMAAMQMYDTCRNRGNPDDAIKYPSRSVPSTPLPFLHPLDFNASVAASKSYPSTPLASETFSYGQTHDFLLNGQPIKDKHGLNYLRTEDAGPAAAMYDGDALMDAGKHVNVASLEQNIPDCELISKPTIEDLFQNCA